MKTAKLAILTCMFALLAHATPSPNTANLFAFWNYDFAGNPGVTNFALYYGASSGNYSTRILVGLSTNAMITGLSRGTTYYCSLTALGDGLESDYATEASATTSKKPAKALNFTITTQ